jgi:actin-like ATPase involved in cell morphogenesis
VREEAATQEGRSREAAAESTASAGVFICHEPLTRWIGTHERHKRLQRGASALLFGFGCAEIVVVDMLGNRELPGDEVNYGSGAANPEAIKSRWQLLYGITSLNA